MSSELTFRQSGTLSNLTWYKPDSPRQDNLYVEVCSSDFERVVVNGERTLRPRRPSTYSFTVQWWPDGGKRRKEIRFTYEPKRTAPGGRLAASTVTRLVRERLEGKLS